MTDRKFEIDIRQRVARELNKYMSRKSMDRMCIALRKIAHEIIDLEAGETTIRDIRNGADLQGKS